MHDNLFSVPLFAIDVPNADGHRQALLQHVQSLATSQPSARRSNRGAWHSGPSLMQGRHPAMVGALRALMPAIETELADFHNNWKAQKLVPSSFWAMVMPPQGYCAPHQHVPSPWSAVYYLQVPSQPKQSEPLAGQLEFINPLPAMATIGFANRAIAPKVGQLVVFPGALVHHVHPHEGPEDRVALALNFALTPKS